MDALLCVDFRIAKECACPLRVAKEGVEASQTKFMHASEALRSAETSGQKRRRLEKRSKTSSVLFRNTEEYDLMLERQREREQDLLQKLQKLLEDAGLVKVPSQLPESINPEDGADGLGIIYPDHQADPDFAPGQVSTVPPPNKAERKRQKWIDALLTRRRNVQGQRQEVQNCKRNYATALVQHLFGHPSSNKETFDAIWEDEHKESHEKELREIEDHLVFLENDYRAFRDKFAAQGYTYQVPPLAPSLPLAPDWAGGENDVDWDEASSHAPFWDSTKLEKNKKGVENFRHGVAKADPQSASGTPGGKVERTGPFPFSPTAFKAMRSPALSKTSGFTEYVEEQRRNG